MVLSFLSISLFTFHNRSENISCWRRPWACHVCVAATASARSDRAATSSAFSESFVSPSSSESTRYPGQAVPTETIASFSSSTSLANCRVLARSSSSSWIRSATLFCMTEGHHTAMCS